MKNHGLPTKQRTNLSMNHKLTTKTSLYLISPKPNIVEEIKSSTSDTKYGKVFITSPPGPSIPCIDRDEGKSFGFSCCQRVEQWKWQLFTKNIGLYKVVRPCMGADTYPVSEGQGSWWLDDRGGNDLHGFRGTILVKNRLSWLRWALLRRVPTRMIIPSPSLVTLSRTKKDSLISQGS